MQLSLSGLKDIGSAKLQDKHKIGLFFVGIVCIILLFYEFLFLPQLERINELNQQYENNKQRVQLIEAFALAHPDLDQYLMDMGNRFEEANSAIPDMFDSGIFLREVENSAKVSGVEMLQFKVVSWLNDKGARETWKNKNGYREFTIEILARGSFQQILGFYKELESSKRFSAVTSTVISTLPINMDSQSQATNTTNTANQTQTSNGILNIKITANIYSYGVVQQPEGQTTQPNSGGAR